jgi:predicted aspartyl protease
MATLHGSLDSSHSPLVTIAVSAPSGPSHFVDALIDTGFTGFVQLPERHARDLGLTLRAVSEAQYADGRTGTIPLAWAKVTLGPDVQEGFAHIQSGSGEVIVGVELLRVFRKVFVLSIADGLVLLADTLADLPSGY